MTKPRVLLSPAPRALDQLFRPATFAALADAFDVVVLDDVDKLDEYLGDAFAIVGQPDLHSGRLDRAPRLRAVLNVEGNFLPNVDYAHCFARGIYVLGCGPAFARPVAEFALGLALDLCRGVTREDRAMRAGTERAVPASTSDSIMLRAANVGFLGFGHVGRALHELLEPFRPVIRVYDPWLPDGALTAHGVRAASLVETLSASDVLFVLATATEESEQLLGAQQLALLPEHARVVLVSRAAVVDFDALLDAVATGRLTAAIDVWPQEPVPPSHRARSLDGLVLSAHRAGGIPSAFLEIGEMVYEDLSLLARGLPPVRMQVAARELVDRYRNRPVG